MVRVLVAPDSFKGSISSQTFCDIIQEVILSFSPMTECVLCPLSDGGEGFTACFLADSSWQAHSSSLPDFKSQLKDFPTEDPLGRPIMGQVGWTMKDSHKWGILEMANASGLPRLKPEEYNPLRASSFGTGQLVDSLLGEGCGTIVIGFGGTATNDGGVGILEALGFSFLDGTGNPIPRGAFDLKNIRKIIAPSPQTPLFETKFILATDVKNPLLGLHGASTTFGPQKGATQHDILTLEEGLSHLAKVVYETIGKDLSQEPGSGAAGGAVFLLRSFLKSRIVSGFDLIAEKNNLPTQIKNNLFDLVITGEGCLDQQSFDGKVVGQLAQLCHKSKVPLMALVGKTRITPDACLDRGISYLVTLVDQKVAEKEAITKAPGLLKEKATQILKRLL
jgi:glycerate kinase